jgi:hypothetical protein
VRDSHIGQIEEWAEFVRQNPKEWREIHTKFINSIFINQRRVYKKLANTKEGKNALIEFYGIRNIRGFSDLTDKF